MSSTIKIKKYLWMAAGFLFLGIAYIGVLVPGIPWSTPSLIAAYCFSKSSERFHNYMMNHKLFGPFIKNWNDGRVYPNKVKWIMFICMDASLVIMWFATQNWKAVLGMGVFFALVLVWASRYPSTKEESDRRKAAGEKIGWFK
jgi:uncharacterized membrane protein YbaN (DUF454 family)